MKKTIAFFISLNFLLNSNPVIELKVTIAYNEGKNKGFTMMIRENISLSIHEMTAVAMMIAIIAVLGAIPGIPLGFIPVPIVLQNTGIMMAGELLGPRLGTITVWLFLLLVGLGFPLLSGGRGGLVTLFGPTGGYIFAWLFVPLLIGLSLKTSWHYGMTQGVIEFLIIWLWGVAFVEGIGALWLAPQLHTSLIASLESSIIFIFGDTIKALIAVSIARRLRHIKFFR